MAFSTRIFLLVDTVRLYRLPGSRFAAMLSKPASHAIPQFASQRVRAAEAIVELVDRRPLKVIRMVFFMLGFDERGVVDADALMRHAAAALDTLHAVQPFNEFSREAKVVDGRSRFAVSGGRWRPTPALQALFDNAALGKKKWLSLR
jgi:hypothetical protein